MRHHFKQVSVVPTLMHTPVTDVVGNVPITAQPVPTIEVAAQVAPIAPVSLASELHRLPATHFVPNSPAHVGEFQKLHVLRHTVPAAPSLTHTAPVKQLVDTASCVHAPLSATVPVSMHAPDVPPGSSGTQNCCAVQALGLANAVQEL